MKNKFKILTFICIFFLLVGFAGINTTLFSMGSTTVGINLDDKDIYIGNLYVNGINRFNSISDDMNSFSMYINETSVIDYYVVNNSTQYDYEFSLTCLNNDLTITNLNTSDMAYAGEVTKITFNVSGISSNELLCSLRSTPKSRTSRVNDKKTILFNLDGYENEISYKVVIGNTYSDLPEPILDGYEFLGWYNSQDELIESTTPVTSFSDEILIGKLEQVYCNYEDGTVWNFDYNGTNGTDGSTQKFIVPCEGTYKLETWGAQGGGTVLYPGGTGAYSQGNVYLINNNELYITIGGKGIDGGQDLPEPNSGIFIDGGYNGGGNAITSGSSGGGATHIATSSGLLSTLAQNKSVVYIVSGGGGGGVYHETQAASGKGGDAGGIEGNSGSTGGWCERVPTGGNQTAGGIRSLEPHKVTCGLDGSFGKGADYEYHIYVDDTNHCALSYQSGGGGGWFGGASGRHTGGSGGSSYIGNEHLTNKAMYCYNCTTSNAENTKTISTTCSNITPTENCSKHGNGYARITLIKPSKVMVQPPVITVKSDKWTTNNTVSVLKAGLAGSGIKNYEYYLTDDNSIPNKDTIPSGVTDNSVLISSNGIWKIYYRTVSNKGNKSEWSEPQSVLIDNTIPSITINPSIPSNITKGDNYNVLENYKANGLSNVTVNCNYNNTSTLAVGTYTLECTAKNEAGNDKTVTKNLSVTYSPYTATNLSENVLYNDNWYNGTFKRSESTTIYTIHNNSQGFLRNNLANTTNRTNHYIYGRVDTLRTSTDLSPGIYVTSGNKIGSWPTTVSECSGWDYYTAINTWGSASCSYKSTQPYITNLMLAQAEKVGSGTTYFKNLIVIDLTATFGSGNEPSKEWCDSHIRFFDGTKTIYK